MTTFEKLCAMKIRGNIQIGTHLSFYECDQTKTVFLAHHQLNSLDQLKGDHDTFHKYYYSHLNHIYIPTLTYEILVQDTSHN